MHHGRIRGSFALSIAILVMGCGEGAYRGIDKTISFYGHDDRVVWVASQDGINNDWKVIQASPADSATPEGMTPYRFQLRSEDERYGLAYVTNESDRYTLHIRFLTASDSTEVYHVNFSHGENTPVKLRGTVTLNSNESNATIYTNSGGSLAKSSEGTLEYSTILYPGITDIAAIESNESVPRNFVLNRDVKITEDTVFDIDFTKQSIPARPFHIDLDENEKELSASVFLKLKGGTNVNVFTKNDKKFYLPESGLVEGDFVQVFLNSTIKQDRFKNVATSKFMSQFYAANLAKNIEHNHSDLNELTTVSARTNGYTYGQFIISGLTFNRKQENPPLTGYEVWLTQEKNKKFNSHIIVTQAWIKSTNTILTPEFSLIGGYAPGWQFIDREPIFVKAGAILATDAKALDIFNYLQKDLKDGAKVYKSWQYLEMLTPMTGRYPPSVANAAS